MNHREYLRTWGLMPKFENVFGDSGESPTDDEKPIPAGETRKSRSAFWRQEPGAWLGKQPRFADFIAQMDSREHRVLDVGCGEGMYRDEISRRAHYVGMDFDESMDPEAVCNFNTDPFPFPDESFDFLFCLSVLEHVMYPFAVMEEIRRVMKPGGRGYIAVPFHYKAHGSPWDFFRYSKGGLHLLLREFESIEIYPIGGAFSVLCHICWNFGRALDEKHVFLGNMHRAVVGCVFRALNRLDRFDPYRIFTRGHYAFFRKAEMQRSK